MNKQAIGSTKLSAGVGARHRRSWLGSLLLLFCLLLGTATLAAAETALVTKEIRASTSQAMETTPTLGVDTHTRVVIYTSYTLEAGGIGQGQIYYQRLSETGVIGGPVRISDGATHDELNDVSGDYVVYTAYYDRAATLGEVRLYQISTGVTTKLSMVDIIFEARISGNHVAWVQGNPTMTSVLLLDIRQPGLNPQIIAGPMPNAINVEIGDTLVVWEESTGPDRNIGYYDLRSGEAHQLTFGGADVGHALPSTAGPWIVWEQFDLYNPGTAIFAHNVDTGERVGVTSFGSLSFAPTMDGEFVAYESNQDGDFDIYLFDLSTNATHQVTTDQDLDQRLNNIYGDQIAYADDRAGNYDVYVSTFKLVEAPVALVSASPMDGWAPLTVRFDGTGSSDPENQALTYHWDFGDSTESEEPVVDHIYDVAGSYVAVLTVTDSDGATDSAPIAIEVRDFSNVPPWAVVDPEQTTVVNQPVLLDGSGSWDPDGNPLTFTWSIVPESVPAGSSVTLSDPALEDLTFSADLPGNYVLYLEVSDGMDPSDPAFVTVTVTEVVSLPPMAIAGDDQTVPVGTLVSLDGSASNDPDLAYPLSYFWTLVEQPDGSVATLSDPDAVAPSFLADRPGDFRLQLIVTDNSGLQSAPDEVVVSTVNSAPIADAGEDRAITLLGTLVTLDGTQSYDEDGDPISYKWQLLRRPVASSALLDDPQSATPSLVADVQGEYEISLVVTDIYGSTSSEDRVLVSFTNLQPVAKVDGAQAVLVNEQVFLDGSGSFDANLDLLSYRWSLVMVPTDSAVGLSDPASPLTSFVADLPGEYIVSLVVNDGLIDSKPTNTTIIAVTVQSEATGKLQEAIDAINLLNPSDLKNRNMARTLGHKINVVLVDIDAGNHAEALDKLRNDILKKTDGCALNGEKDKNDWLTDCEAQAMVYPLLMEAVELLEGLLP